MLLEKYSLKYYCNVITHIKHALDKGSLESLIKEIVSTQRELRSRVTPKYKFDERWEDFKKCLLLDGYKINEDNSIIYIEPKIDGIIATEDD